MTLLPHSGGAVRIGSDNTVLISGYYSHPDSSQ